MGIKDKNLNFIPTSPHSTPDNICAVIFQFYCAVFIVIVNMSKPTVHNLRHNRSPCLRSPMGIMWEYFLTKAAMVPMKQGISEQEVITGMKMTKI